MRTPDTRLSLALRWAALVLALVIYVAVLWQFTFTGTLRPGHTEPEVNLVPFRSIIDTIESPLRRGGVLYVLGGNALMLAPLAVVAVALLRRSRPWLVLLLLTAVTTAIETGQFLANKGRVVDVDDVILNALGGWGVYLVLHRVVPPLRGWARSTPHPVLR